MIHKKLLDDRRVWTSIKNNKNKEFFRKKIKYLLSEYGTKHQCNRFDVGNSIEFIMADMITDSGNLKAKELPNARRIDLQLYNENKYRNIYDLSIKYSSVGDITLHNSNSCINTDFSVQNLLLLTNKYIFLITPDMLYENNCDIEDYLHNSGDSLKLKRKLVTKLEKGLYPYKTHFLLDINERKNKLCSRVFYEKFSNDFEKSLVSVN